MRDCGLAAVRPMKRPARGPSGPEGQRTLLPESMQYPGCQANGSGAVKQCPGARITVLPQTGRAEIYQDLVLAVCVTIGQHDAGRRRGGQKRPAGLMTP